MVRSRLTRISALATVLLLVVAACSGNKAAPASSAEATAIARAATAEPTREPMSLGGTDTQMCTFVADLQANTASLRAVELKLVNRVALDIELSKVQAAFDELDGADLGELEEQLETPLTRLGYRLGELELAVEDFRTNSRIKRAVPHVEEDADTFATELAAFSLLARC